MKDLDNMEMKTMGTTSRVAMHSIAYKAAIENGPRIVTYKKGMEIAAYTLRKDELARLFELNGYSTDRIAWLKTIRSWGNYFGDHAPADDVLFNKDAFWTFIIGNLDEWDSDKLEDFASANKVPAYGLYNRQRQTDVDDFGSVKA